MVGANWEENQTAVEMHYVYERMRISLHLIPITEQKPDYDAYKMAIDALFKKGPEWQFRGQIVAYPDAEHVLVMTELGEVRSYKITYGRRAV